MYFGKNSAPRRPMSRREVIVLTLDTGDIVYFAAKVDRFGSWHTPDINRAKVYRHPMYAQSVISGRRMAWATLNPRIVDPRGIAGYVDKPMAAGRRQTRIDLVGKRPTKPAPTLREVATVTTATKGDDE
jgi:hypothetical protein